MSEQVNGWSPPLVFDIYEGQRRIATQQDIDRLEAIAAAYSIVIQVVKEQTATVESRIRSLLEPS